MNMPAMMQDLANYALLLSVHLVIILLLRKKIRLWFGAVAAYQLWLLPLLCLPFYLVDWSFLHALTYNDDSITAGVLRPATDMVARGVDVGRLGPVLFQPNDGLSPWTWGFMAWLVVVLILAGAVGFKWRRFSRFIDKQEAQPKSGELHKLVRRYGFPDQIEVVMLNGIGSPALYGFMRPRLLIPADFLESFDEDQRHIMLTHEAIHFHRRDNLWSTAAFIAGVFFWFNPLVYLMYPLFRIDQELSCDALTLRRCNPAQRTLYPKTLVDSANIDDAGHDPVVVSNWNNFKDLKVRTTMMNKHLTHKTGSFHARLALLSVLLCGGFVSFVFAGNAPTTIEAEIIPAQYLGFFTEETRNRLATRDNPRDPVPTDSDHLVFIIDSSGSMINYAWEQALYEVRRIVNRYPNLEAFQMINDMGQYLVPETRRQWIEATDNEIDNAIDRLRAFNGFSNSSPIEGLSEALEYLVEPAMSASIYLIGDELSPQTSPEDVLGLVSERALGVRIHTLMFPVYYTQPARYHLVANKFVDTMLQVAEMTEGSFELVE